MSIVPSLSLATIYECSLRKIQIQQRDNSQRKTMSKLIDTNNISLFVCVWTRICRFLDPFCMCVCRVYFSLLICELLCT